MTLTQKQLTDTELEDLGRELTLSAFDGTLTEKRYDELVELLINEKTYPDVAMSIILDGLPAWRAKHIKRYNIKAAIRAA
jgi:hypothetical protein